MSLDPNEAIETVPAGLYEVGPERRLLFDTRASEPKQTPARVVASQPPEVKRMDRLWQDVRYGARVLRRSPSMTAAALVALALGTGVNTALFSIVDAVVLRPLPFPEPHELVRVWRTELPRLQYGSASYARYVDWRARNRVFEEMGAYAPRGLTLTGSEAPERVPAARASASFFGALGAPALRGRYFNKDEDRPGAGKVVVLGEQLWRRRFGADPAVVGSTLTLDGELHTVVGVAPPSYADTWGPQAWVPLALPIDPAQRGSNFLVVVARLRPGMTIAAAQAGLHDLAAELRREHPDDIYGFLVRGQHDVMTDGTRQALLVLLGATGLVLLIACANVTNLLLARTVSRQKEMAVRTALGAGRARLARQLVTETLLLAFAGGGLGLALAAGLLRVFALVAPASFPRLAEVGLDLRVLAFSLGVALLAGLVAGVLPGLQVARAQPGDALRDASMRGATSGRARAASRFLVVSEVALALMLVAAAGLSVRSLQELLRQDLGLRPAGVLTFSVALPRALEGDSAGGARFFSAFEERLRALPGVASVGAISMLPIAATGMNAPVQLPESAVSPEEAPLGELRAVTPGYFDTMGVPLLAGRGPDERDHAGSAPVVVLNETMAGLLWPGQPVAAAVGKRVALGWDESGVTREAIGVTRDVRSRRPDAPPDGETYVPHAQASETSMAFTVRTGLAAAGLVPAVRRELAALDPSLPLASIRTFEEVVASATRSSRLYAALTALFGVLAASLAIVGIYSLVSYAVAQSVRELAIRSALGASRRRLLEMVLREGFALSAAGIALGLLGALAASRVMRSLLYNVSATDPAVFILTAAGVALLAALGYGVPAWRASRVEPAVALRAE